MRPRTKQLVLETVRAFSLIMLIAAAAHIGLAMLL